MASSFVGSGASRNAELSPFGQKQAVKKVIDYKIDNGRRFYKVKWECSWEAEENLLEYQNLVDQFWGFVNRVKSEDGRAGLKQVHSEDSGNVSCQNQDSSKAANRKLITFVTAAPAKIGDSTLKAILPSNLKPAQGSDLSKTQGKELTEKLSPETCFTRDSNDLELHWDNPYVRIAFFCRVCCMEESFCNNEQNWKSHFMSHVHLQPEDSNPNWQTAVLTEADEEMFKDPDRPWIQKVEHLIQKWGVNQYVRLAFLCRVCGKEQQAQHTGNWRNHHMSHRLNRPFHCETCSKTFKSKHDLKRHKLAVHEDREPSYVRVQSCRICSRQFKRRFDMKRHIAQVHNIDPENLALPDLENESIQPPEKVFVTSHTETTSHTLADNNIHFATGNHGNDKLPVPDQPLQSECRYKELESVRLPSNTCAIALDESPISEVQSHQTENRLKTTGHIVESRGLADDHASTPSSNEIPKNFVCCSCFQSFPSKSDLCKHQKKSPGCCQDDDELRVHVCKICGRGFKRKYDMNRHTSNVHSMDFEQAKLVNTDMSADVVSDDGQFASMCVVKPSPREEGYESSLTEETEHKTLLEHQKENTPSTFNEQVMLIKVEPDDERPCLVIDEEERRSNSF